MTYLKSSILFLLLSSCAVLEKTSNPLEQFIKTELAQGQEIVIIKDKVNTRTVMRILYGNDNPSEDYENSIPVDSGRSKLLTAKDWKEIYRGKISDKVAGKWKNTDFSNLKFVFENQVGLWNNNFLARYSENQKRIIWLSEPIYYVKKKYLIFYYAVGTTSIPGSNERNVVIIAKESDRWKTVEIIEDYVIH